MLCSSFVPIFKIAENSSSFFCWHFTTSHLSLSCQTKRREKKTETEMFKSYLTSQPSPLFLIFIETAKLKLDFENTNWYKWSQAENWVSVHPDELKFPIFFVKQQNGFSCKKSGSYNDQNRKTQIWRKWPDRAIKIIYKNWNLSVGGRSYARWYFRRVIKGGIVSNPVSNFNNAGWEKKEEEKNERVMENFILPEFVERVAR